VKLERLVGRVERAELVRVTGGVFECAVGWAAGTALMNVATADRLCCLYPRGESLASYPYSSDEASEHLAKTKSGGHPITLCEVIKVQL
jgi:hypothetical protein